VTTGGQTELESRYRSHPQTSPLTFAEKSGECRQIANPMPLRAHLNAYLNMIAAWT
jgi:hypothetical protein